MYYNNKTPDPVRGPHPEHDLEGKGVPNVISDIVDNWFLCDSRISLFALAPGFYGCPFEWVLP